MTALEASRRCFCVVAAALASSCTPPGAPTCIAKVDVAQPQPKPLAANGDAAHVLITQAGSVVFDDTALDLEGKGKTGGEVVALDASSAAAGALVVGAGKGFGLSLAVFSALDNTIVANGRQGFDCVAPSSESRTVDVPLYLGPANAFAVAAAPPAGFSGATDLTANALPDGRVLVVGGASVATPPSTGAVIFDPKAANGAGAWCTSCVSSPPPPRAQHSATSLPDGRVVVVGGVDASNAAVSDIVVFDPASTSFSTGVASLKITGHAAAAIDGAVLVAGGFDGTNANHTVANAFLVAADGSSATPLQPMLHARAHAAAVTLASDKVLVVGGEDDVGPLDTLELYDSATQTFNPPQLDCESRGNGQQLCSKRTRATALVLDDGNVLIAGGTATPLDGDPNPVPSAEVFLLDEERVLVASATDDGFSGAVSLARIACAQSPCPTLVIGPSPFREFTIAASAPSLGDKFYDGHFLDAAHNLASAPSTGGAAASLVDGSVLVVGGLAQDGVSPFGVARFSSCDGGGGLTCPAP
jgi:hypothetical protein